MKATTIRKWIHSVGDMKGEGGELKWNHRGEGGGEMKLQRRKRHESLFGFKKLNNRGRVAWF